MRLWHQYLIPYLDNQRILGQHRECCALRGKGWGKKHSTVNYVFDHHISCLIQYHLLIMDECRCRGFNIDNKWMQVNYRGKNILEFSSDIINNRSYFENINLDAMCVPINNEHHINDIWIYPEHDLKYLYECLNNLESKNVEFPLED